MARPKKKGETRSIRTIIYLTPSEANILKEDAASEYTTVSEILRNLWKSNSERWITYKNSLRS